MRNRRGRRMEKAIKFSSWEKGRTGQDGVNVREKRVREDGGGNTYSGPVSS